MPTRVLLEGPEIEPLLAKVREQYGPGARIISAQKVRVGGVGGFFARERYELSVEVPDDPPTALPSPSQAAERSPDRESSSPRSLNDLLTMAEEAEHKLATVGSSEATNRVSPPQTPTATSTTPGSPGTSFSAATTAARPTVATPSAPSASPSSAGAPASASPRPVASPWASLGSTRTPSTSATPATSSASAPTAPTPPSAATASGASAATPWTPPRPTPTGLPRGFSLIDPSTLATATPTRSSTPTAESATPEPARQPTPAPSTSSSTARSFGQVMAEVGGVSTSLAVRSQETHAVAESPRHAATESSGTRVAAPSAPVATRLIDLGVPRPLANRVTGTDVFGEVLAALRTMPPPPRPPRGAGEVLVIAGEMTYAMPIAQTVARSLHLDPNRILLAGPSIAGTGLPASRRISGPAEAERRARHLHRSDVPHVVVVDAPVTAGDDGWVRSIADALDATALWAAVDATRKLADTARHLSTMGRVDALAVYAAAVCSDPAGVLALNVPVALLDGRPATPAAWAALLAERLHTLPTPAA